MLVLSTKPFQKLTGTDRPMYWVGLTLWLKTEFCHPDKQADTCRRPLTNKLSSEVALTLHIDKNSRHQLPSSNWHRLLVPSKIVLHFCVIMCSHFLNCFIISSVANNLILIWWFCNGGNKQIKYLHLRNHVYKSNFPPLCRLAKRWLMSGIWMFYCKMAKLQTYLVNCQNQPLTQFNSKQL